MPQLVIYNKCELLDDHPPRIERDAEGRPVAVWLSAQTGAGLELLGEALVDLLGTNMVSGRLCLPSHMGALRARLHAASAVQNERFLDDGSCELDIRLPEAELARMLSNDRIAVAELNWRERAA